MLVLGGTVFAMAAPARALAWCGNGAGSTDRLPDTTASYQIHVVYATSSDGGDRFDVAAPAIESEIAAIDRWWRNQDPTRAPRWDTASFGSCSGFDALDISHVRLPRPTSYYGAVGGADSLDRIAADLASAPFGFSDPAKKYLVFYDAPTGDPTVCGIANIRRRPAAPTRTRSSSSDRASTTISAAGATSRRSPHTS